MYQAHWGLDRCPFPSGIDPRPFYEGSCQREALARMRHLVESGRRLALLLGEAGLGKSRLLEAFSQECRLRTHSVAQVDLLALTASEFLWQLGAELQTTHVEDDRVRQYRRLADRLFENRVQGISTILLLDNAGRAGPDLLSHLLRLAHHGVDDGWLTIVLAANRADVARLGEELAQLVDLPIDLEAWDELDTVGYLQLALVEAGSQRPLLDEYALGEIFRLTGGVPRLINRLADQALLTGSRRGLDLIDVDTVQTASEALRLPAAC